MRIVGLTGGIGSGESTVSNLFKTEGIPAVDADIVARDVLKKETGGWRKVVAAFGDEILLPSGEVDRPKLGRIVFNYHDKRQLLNRQKSLLPAFESAEIFTSCLCRDIIHGRPDVKCESIKGLENAKQLLKEAVVMPIKYSQYFTRLLTPWKGILLFGPLGTGMTMLAKAV